MKKKAVFPGSFDPITTGHVDILMRSLPLFDEIVVAIGINSQKKYLYTVEERTKWMQEIFKDAPKITVAHFVGLTFEFCKSIKANYIIRGLRNASDFDYEKTISQLNNEMAPEIETVFLIAKPELSHISSTIVRELMSGGADVSKIVPKQVLSRIEINKSNNFKPSSESSINK